MESQTKLMSWYWEQKLTWGKDLITCNVHPWIMFSFNWLVIIWRWFVEGGGRGVIWNWTLKVKWVEEFWTQLDKGLGGLENFPIFMDVICVSSITSLLKKSFAPAPESISLNKFTKFLRCQQEPDKNRLIIINWTYPSTQISK